MKNLRKISVSFAICLVLLVSTTFAQKGIILGDANENQVPCAENKTDEKNINKIDSGIIVLLTGIIVLLVDEPSNCGIIVL